jgi:hypothetical protein
MSSSMIHGVGRDAARIVEAIMQRVRKSPANASVLAAAAVGASSR